MSIFNETIFPDKYEETQMESVVSSHTLDILGSVSFRTPADDPVIKVTPNVMNLLYVVTLFVCT